MIILYKIFYILLLGSIGFYLIYDIKKFLLKKLPEDKSLQKALNDFAWSFLTLLIGLILLLIIYLI